MFPGSSKDQDTVSALPSCRRPIGAQALRAAPSVATGRVCRAAAVVGRPPGRGSRFPFDARSASRAALSPRATPRNIRVAGRGVAAIHPRTIRVAGRGVAGDSSRRTICVAGRGVAATCLGGCRVDDAEVASTPLRDTYSYICLRTPLRRPGPARRPPSDASSTPRATAPSTTPRQVFPARAAADRAPQVKRQCCTRLQKINGMTKQRVRAAARTTRRVARWNRPDADADGDAHGDARDGKADRDAHGDAHDGDAHGDALPHVAKRRSPTWTPRSPTRR